MNSEFFNAIEQIEKEKVIAIIRGADADQCMKVAEALYEGGIRLMEITYNQKAPESFRTTAATIGALAKAFEGRMLIGAGTVTTVLVTVLGLVCAMTPLGKMAGVEEMSSVYLYAVVSLLASRASLLDLVDAPMWVVYGFVILLVHVVLMFVLSKIFKWDLCMVSTASLANIGGSASAPIVATAYNANFAGIGVLMGILGQAIGNLCGLAMGAILQLFV